MTPEQRLKDIEDELAKIEAEAKALVARERETPLEEFSNLFQYWVWLFFIKENEYWGPGSRCPMGTDRLSPERRSRSKGLIPLPQSYQGKRLTTTGPRSGTASM